MDGIRLKTISLLKMIIPSSKLWSQFRSKEPFQFYRKFHHAMQQNSNEESSESADDDGDEEEDEQDT